MRITVQTLQVLQALLDEPATERYGLEISEGSGLPTGTVYPILTRLEEAGWIHSTWENVDESAAGRRARCYYRLTTAGMEAARSEIATMQERLADASEGVAQARHERRAQERMALESFEVFYKMYRPRLARYLMTQTQSALAEDVADDAMMAAWDRWDELLTYERPVSWLFKVATRLVRRLEARARNMGALLEDIESVQDDLHAVPNPDDWVTDHIDLIAGIRSLPRRQSEVIGLHYLGGYSIAETAQILGITDGTAKRHMQRGLDALRRREGVPAALRSVIRSLA